MGGRGLGSEESAATRRAKRFDARHNVTTATREGSASWQGDDYVEIVLAAAVAVMTLGCAQGPSATAAVVADKTYTVTPASVTAKAGISALLLTGQHPGKST